MILEPIPESEISEYRNLLRGQTVYGVFRRQDLPPGVLQLMQEWRPAELLPANRFQMGGRVRFRAVQIDV
jgi:hypothetical protein